MDTLILRLGKADGDGFVARLFGDGEQPLTTHAFVLDDPGALADRFRLATGGQPLTQLGGELFGLIAPALLPFAERRQQGQPARLLLQIEAEQLRPLPWELMIGDGLRWATAADFPIARLRPRDQPLTALDEHDWPLRLLLVVGSEAGDADVAAEMEIDEIRDAIVPHEAALDWKLLWRPSPERMLDEIVQFEPHIFHFIGHAGDSHGEPVLKLFNPQTQQNENLKASTLRERLFGKVDKLRLAYLNACRTADEARVGLWSVSDALLDAGATALVGTTAVIGGAAAARCAGVFYAELFADLAIDVAMARARERMGSSELRDWATPCLTLRVAPSELLASPAKLYARPQELKRQFWEVRKYVGRRDLYRRAWLAHSADERRPTVIKGRADIGKTAAAKMLLERCLMADHAVRYVDMRGRGGDYVDLMEATIAGDAAQWPPEPHTEPLDAALLDELATLIEQTLGAQKDRRTPANERKLFGGFRALIEKAFPERQILLVYDHLDGMEITSLIETIKQFDGWHKASGRVHTLLVIGDVEDRQLRDRNIRIEAPYWVVLPVDMFEAARYKDLGPEFMRRLAIAYEVRDGQPFDEQVRRQYLTTASAFVANLPVDTDWSPDVLANLEGLVKGFKLLPNV